MGTRTSLPPTGRDHQAYRLVHVEQRTTREAAELVGISQTRGCQAKEQTKESDEELTAEATDASPPEEDCSAPATEQPFQAPIDSHAGVANDALDGICDRDMESSRAPENGQPRPVQPP